MQNDIEAGDIVEVVATKDKESRGFLSLHGVFDMEWTLDGETVFTVLFDGEDFAYATEIKLIRKR
jgi:hypothetical protein